jgi:DNA-binding GntR family transcriptional regulator
MKTRSAAPLLSELAYERILEALLDARLPMGQKVSQSLLTQVTGIPVGPVRDALKVLEADSVVKVHPRSGIAFIRPSTDLVRATYQFRTIIERAAIRQFAISAPKAVLTQLLDDHIKAELEFKVLDPNTNVVRRQSEIENSFHPVIVAVFKNELVDASYRRLQLMARIIKLEKDVYPRSAMLSVAEHKTVLKACLDRDADAADAAISQHLSNALVRNLGVQ